MSNVEAQHERKVTTMEVRTLKPYKGFEIEKSYETKKDGTIRKESIVYSAYGLEDEIYYDSDTTLAGMKKKIDIYLNGAKSLDEIINR